jgi:hypothetical protein
VPDMFLAWLRQAYRGSGAEVLKLPDGARVHVDDDWQCLRVAEPEGPSFISRTVAQRRLDRRYS